MRQQHNNKLQISLVFEMFEGKKICFDTFNLNVNDSYIV